MKDARRRWLVLLCVLQAGCSSAYYGAKNLIEAPIDSRDRQLIRCRFDRMADDAWTHAVENDPQLAYAYHYGVGFRRGFADYLNADGTGQPPAEPPWIYRTAAFETPQGKRDVEDWYAGFRQGAADARAGGYRDAAVVLPIALPPENYSPRPTSQPPSAVLAPPPPASDPELLPPPHKAPMPPDAPGDGRPRP